MNKRILSLVMALAMALALLTGCGQASSPSADESIPVDNLSWEFITEKDSMTTTEGVEVYYNETVYPVFEGDNTELVNNWVQAYVHPDAEGDISDGIYSSDPDELYQQYAADYGEDTLKDMLPFFDYLNLDTVYADGMYVSVTGDCGFWSGGTHPYSYQCGAVLYRDTGSEVLLSDMVGDADAMEALVRENDTNGELAEHDVSYPECWALSDEGIVLYYNVGDALPRVEILIPNGSFAVG